MCTRILPCQTIFYRVSGIGLHSGAGVSGRGAEGTQDCFINQSSSTPVPESLNPISLFICPNPSAGHPSRATDPENRSADARRRAIKHILLIHPPVAKACEPPGGIARLAGCLKEHGVGCTVLDANLEGQLRLLAEAAEPSGEKFDTWTDRARRRLPEHLAALRGSKLYGNADRYRRCVNDVSRLLALRGRETGVTISLADYQDRRLSPLRTGDLLRAAREYASNPFMPGLAERIEALVDENAPGAVGVSLNYLSQALSAFALIGFIRDRFPRIATVLGGGLVTSWLRLTGGRNPFGRLVDHCVAGPGESFLLGLVGLPSDVGRFARPDYAGFPAGRYLSPGPVLPYSASSGCHWRRCTFCPERAEGQCYRPVPEGQVLSDLGALVSDVRPALIHFLDSTMSPRLLERLTLHAPGAPWYGFTRVSPRLGDGDFCRALRASGCVMLKLGLESGDQGVLDALEKGIRVDEASQALKALKGAGIGTYVYLLFGTPAETPEAAQRTLSFTAEHSRLIDFLNLAVFNLPAGSEEAGRLNVHPFYEGDLSLYADFEHPDRWGRREVRDFLDREFRRHPSIAPIVRRQPPFFTSNHAPFLPNFS